MDDLEASTIRTSRMGNYYFQQGEIAFKAMQEVHERLTSKQYELSDMFCAMLEASNMFSPIERWVQDRRNLPTQDLRDIHWRTNFRADFPPAVKKHVEDDHRVHDYNIRRGNANITQIGTGDELNKAMDNFEMCHWNRLVARDDFEDRKELIQAKQEADIQPVIWYQEWW